MNRMRPPAWAAACAAVLSPCAAQDEIVVTAERRAQLAAEVPASVARLGEDEIDRIGADHASEIFARVPGVLIHRGSGQEHLTAIRSPVLTGGAGAGSFLFLENGVPLRSAGFANVNALFEAHTEIASAIEVLRGPGGPLYGANAVHGVVNVLTPAPSEELSGSLAVSGDTVKRFKGVAEISDSFGGHGVYGGLSLSSEHGFRADSGLDQQKATVRHDWAGSAVSVSTILSAINLNQETAGFLVGPDAYLDPVLRRGNDNPEAFRDARAVRLASRIDIEAADNVEVSVTPFARYTEMAFLLHFFPSKALEENAHWSVGAQSAVYAHLSEGLAVIAGLDVEHTYGDLSEAQSIPTIGTFTQGVHYDYAVVADSLSGFAQVSYDITSRLRATAGARLDYTRYDYDNRTADGIVGRFLRPPDGVDEFVTASPKATLLYETDTGAIYVSYARGARPPQTTDLYRLQINQTADGADPEFVDSFEIGWRGAVGDFAQLDLAGYFMKKRNFFFRDADGFNVDDGKTRHVGAEAALTVRPHAALTLDLNAGYGRHTYRFDRPVLSLPQASEAISFGDDVDTAPRWLAGGRLLWTPDPGFEAEAEWVFVGGYFTDAANTQTYPGHQVLNLRAALRLSEHMQLTAVVRNLLDTLYAERADFAFGEERYFPAEERTIGLGLRAQL
jgi:outer membrane receptor protein involved in Fe transport